MARRRRKRTPKREPLLEAEMKREIIVVLLFTLAGLALLSYFNLAGRAGVFIDEALKGFLGTFRPLLPVMLIIAGILASMNARGMVFLGLIITLLSIAALAHLAQFPGEAGIDAVAHGVGGGYAGLFLAHPLYQVFGLWAALVILIALLLVGLTLSSSAPLAVLLAAGRHLGAAAAAAGRAFLKPFRRTKIHGDYYAKEETQQTDGFKSKTIDREESAADIDEIGNGKESEAVPPDDESVEDNAENSAEDQSPRAPRRIGPIEIPLDLLEKNGSKPISGNIRERQNIIVKTLENFGIDVEMGDVSVGPTVTQYTLRPAVGVKLASITALANDLSLALAAHPIRIEAPIPGKSLVGIEVPNDQVSIVRLRETLESGEWQHRSSSLSVVLGRDVAGHPRIADLARMPHLLVAGATGSGKTVCLNTIILALLYQNGPDDLKFILIDPKRVELPSYNGIPHLLTPVITDFKQTVQILRWSITEMERRFETLAGSGARDIKSFNDGRAPEERMPYLVIIVDELADLMVAAASEVEAAIIRLAQMARAVGIHLILATQRPSVDVITGLIKANITSRIAFSVASLTDSRTILDMSGAEKLLGRGDMLFMTAELAKPKRLQGVYVSDQEIKKIVAYLKQAGSPSYMEIPAPGRTSIGTAISENNDEDSDPLLTDAKEIILQAGKASASLLQRRLKVGYARAARILDLLEEEGFIGPSNGAKPREILAPKG